MRHLPFTTALFISLFLFYCTRDSAHVSGHGMSIEPWKADSRYWAWNGEEPTLLLGAGSDDNLFLSGSFRQELGALNDAGGNYVRCVLHSRGKRDRQPFALDTVTQQYLTNLPDSLYWASLTELLQLASSYNHVVQLEGWRGEQYRRDSSLRLDFHEAFIRQVDAATAGLRNILYASPETTKAHPIELSSHSFARPRSPLFIENSRLQYGLEGQAHWRWLLANPRQTSATRNAAALTGHGPNPAFVDGTAQLNRALLAGYAAARHAREPIGNGLNGRALSSIRTIRTIERSFKFWDLRPAPEIIVGEAGEAYPAKDSLGNYLVYLAGPGAVTVQLDTEEQTPMRVSVVGYLGTRRSELLKPPYGSTFTISTEDDRGAWLLMKRVD